MLYFYLVSQFSYDKAQRQRRICEGARIVIREMASDHLLAILADMITPNLQVALHFYEFTATAPGKWTSHWMSLRLGCTDYDESHFLGYGCVQLMTYAHIV